MLIVTDGVQRCLRYNFSLLAAGSATIHAFLEFLLPVLCKKTLSLIFCRLSHLVEIMVKSDRIMNPVAITIINLLSEICHTRDLTNNLLLTLSQTANFRSFHTQSVCRQ